MTLGETEINNNEIYVLMVDHIQELERDKGVKLYQRGVFTILLNT